MLASYRDFLTVMIVALTPIIALGMVLHEPVNVREIRVHKEVQRLEVGSLAGLLIVYLFFAGQTGYLSYVIQQAIARGMTFEVAVLSLALMKISAGIWVLCSSCVNKDSKSGSFWSLTLILIGAIVALFYSRHVAVFFVALLAIEMALNNLSARLQAAVVAAWPEFGGRWLTGIMLLGAASGPPLNGFAIGIGWEGAFVLICILSSLGPLFWQQWRSHSDNAVEIART
jgi:hypothetical protein